MEEQREQKPREKCAKCGVPHDVHGTCCEWWNASTIVLRHDDGLFYINDPEHPYYNRKSDDWWMDQYQILHGTELSVSKMHAELTALREENRQLKTELDEMKKGR